jgi:hypothetical protein
LEPVRGRLRALATKCSMTVCICYHGYVSRLGSWHLDNETISQLAALGLDVDLDLYADGPELLDDL